MIKKITLILITLFYFFASAFAEKNLEDTLNELPIHTFRYADKLYNFWIWEVESIKIIDIADNYPLDEEYKWNVWDKIYLIKIKDFNIFSSLDDNFNIKIQDYYKDKNLYLFNWPGDFIVGQIYDTVSVWDKIIFRSDMILTKDTLDFWGYDASILNLFYNENSNYIIYEDYVWDFVCNETGWNILPKKWEKFYYTQIASDISNTDLSKEPIINEKPERAEELVKKVINESNICWKYNENIILNNDVIIIWWEYLEETVKYSFKNKIIYIVWILLIFFSVIFVLSRKR
jgi:hypothetical protein